jgi:hypothetical protein
MRPSRSPRPYDRDIEAKEFLAAARAAGEAGWHNAAASNAITAGILPAQSQCRRADFADLRLVVSSCSRAAPTLVGL